MDITIDMISSTTMAGVLVVAAVSDWRTRRIPNKVVLPGLGVALLLAMIGHGGEGLFTALLGLGAGFALTLPGFLMRFTGAGDVKLLSMLGAFVGPSTVLQVFAISVVLGAVLVLLKTLFARRGIHPFAHAQRYASMLHQFFLTREFIYFPPSSESELADRVPMAPIVALATIAALLIWPMLGG